MVRASELAWARGSATGRALLGQPFSPASPCPPWLAAWSLLFSESQVLSPNTAVQVVALISDSLIKRLLDVFKFPALPDGHFDRHFLKIKTQLINNHGVEMGVTQGLTSPG